MREDSSLDSLHVELATRFRALGHLFGQLGSPSAAQGLIDSVTSGGPRMFGELSARLDLPMLGKCFWLREIIERVVVTPTGLVEECWLRDNLTPAERLLYLQIAWRHQQRPPVVAQPDPTFRAGRPVIPPGPFLSELQANGLVTCETRMTYDSRITQVFSKPERVCV